MRRGAHPSEGHDCGATGRVIGEETEIQSKGNHFDLSTAPDAKLLTDLNALLFADHDQAIGNESRQESFDREKQSRSTAPVITVKDVPVICVHKLALAWLADEHTRR